MVEPSNKKILIAVFVLLLIAGVVALAARGYVKRLSATNTTLSSVHVEAGEYFEINVPDDWEYSIEKVGTNKNPLDVYTGPALSEFSVCSGAAEGKADSDSWDRNTVELRIEGFSGVEDFESFKKYYEGDPQSEHPTKVTLIDEVEIGGTTVMSVYQLAPLEKCNLQGFSGMALTKEGGLFFVSSRGPHADYQADFKDIFHSIKLK